MTDAAVSLPVAGLAALMALLPGTGSADTVIAAPHPARGQRDRAA
jgi:hypothetical protein